MKNHQIQCQICQNHFADVEVTPARFVRPPISEMILSEHSDWSPESYICHNDLNHYRSQFVQNELTKENGELTALERDVIESLRQHDILAQNVDATSREKITLGEKLADNVASFGGSWTFIICFASVLIIWIIVNSISLLGKPFDPFPFILLNLVLSCLAAVQAPVIMMSQNRQEAKDRLRAENDYRINLKAELEIRHLHSKMDLLLTHQWQRLLKIQQMQTDLLEELGRNR